jgi:hypothetical protein
MPRLKLTPIENKTENKKAIGLLKDKLSAGSTKFKNIVLGFQGGNLTCDIWWNQKHDFWYFLDPDRKILERIKSNSPELKRARNSKTRVPRTVLFLGLGNPNQSSNLSITVEINLPNEGLSMRIAGCLLSDSRKDIYIGHSGKIGGGRPGIGKTSFTNWYPSEPFTVDWSIDKTRQLLFVTKIKSKTFQSELKTFITRVHDFKKDAMRGLVDLGPSASKSYSPEFSGHRKPYRVESEIQAEVKHGLVVDELKKKLDSKGIRAWSDRRDLYVEKNRGEQPIIFEIKTDVTSSDIVKAIGQLFYYPASFQMNKNTKRVLVMPNNIKALHIKEIQSLGIKIVKYKIGTKVHFYGLEKVFES